MAKVAYPYSQFPIPASDPYPNGQTVFRPLLLATVTAENAETIRCIVWPDSGADCCVFPLAMAIALKLDVLALPKTMTGGVGTTSNVTYYANVTIDIGNGFVFKTYAGFTEGMNAQGLGLLGQCGFFESYQVEFLHKSKIFTVEA